MWASCDGKTGLAGLDLAAWVVEGLSLVDDARLWNIKNKGGTT